MEVKNDVIGVIVCYIRASVVGMSGDRSTLSVKIDLASRIAAPGGGTGRG
jgi:hypothetical protein